MALLCGWIALTNMVSAIVFLPAMILTSMSLSNLHESGRQVTMTSLGNCFSKQLFTGFVGHRGTRWLITASFTVVVVVFLIVAVVNVAVEDQQVKTKLELHVVVTYLKPILMNIATTLARHITSSALS